VDKMSKRFGNVDCATGPMMVLRTRNSVTSGKIYFLRFVVVYAHPSQVFASEGGTRIRPKQPRDEDDDDVFARAAPAASLQYEDHRDNAIAFVREKAAQRLDCAAKYISLSVITQVFLSAKTVDETLERVVAHFRGFRGFRG